MSTSSAPPSSETLASRTRPRRPFWSAALRSPVMGPIVALLAISLVVILTTPSFLELQNFRNITLQVSILSVVAAGATIIILTGGIDLSPGSMMAVMTMLLAVLIRAYDASLWLAIPAVMLAGALLGALNGFLVAKLRIPSFIVTLAGLSSFKGLALMLGTPIFSLSPELSDLFYGSVFGLPLPLIYVLAVYAIAYVLLEHTRIGREIYAIGGNEQAARLSGINVDRVRMAAFILGSLCTSIGAIMLAARLNSGSPNYGNGIELQAIAAVVVGGASLSGGRGRVVSTLIGALIIVVVQNGLNLNSVETSMQSLIIGGIILVAVAIDIWREPISGFFRRRSRRV